MSRNKRKREKNAKNSPHEKKLKISQKSELTNAVNVNKVERLESPEKCETDVHLYRVIELKNGLKALLMSDVDKDENENIITSKDAEGTASCGLCVGSGSNSDPRNVQGLAHLVEHMVHLGTKKYPTENEFSHFISKHGGSTNAETSTEDTMYHFNVDAKHLDDALDRFSDMFVEPLMLKETIQRERESVDSEFSLHKFEERFRHKSFLLSLGRSNHPSSLFGSGNSVTLKDNIDDDDLYKKIHEFRKRYYSADRMYFCVFASMDLDELENLVVKHFSNVPRNNCKPKIYSDQSHNYAFTAKFHKKVFFVKAIKNVSKISITWCLPPMLKDYKCKVDNYIGYMVGHAAKGGLKYYLIKNLWATELTADEHMKCELLSNSLYTLFTIDIKLTGFGFKHLDKVLEATFSYIRFLQCTAPSKRIFKDLQATAQNLFEHRSNGCVRHRLHHIAQNLKNYPLNHTLKGDLLYFEYDPEAIKRRIDHLNTSKFNITITSSELYDKNVVYDLNEKWLDIEYCERDMPEKWSTLHENAQSIAEFSLPKPNPFATDDPFEGCWHGAGVPTQIIMENDVCVLRYERQDRKYAISNFSFESSIATSHKSLVLMDLYTPLLNICTQLSKTLHSALLMEPGCVFIIDEESCSIDFKVYRLDEELDRIVIKFTKMLKTLPEKITEHQFRVCVQEMEKSYDNQIIQSSSLQEDLRTYLLDGDHVSLFDKKQALKTLTFKDFQKFHRKFMQGIRIKSSMSSSLSKRSAERIMDKILDILECDSTNHNNRIRDTAKVCAMQIPVGKSYLRCKNFSQQNENTITENYYQIGRYSHKSNILLQLLENIVEGPIYHNLRTKEQLGYSLHFKTVCQLGILGYTIHIQSQESKFSAEYIDERIENFRKDLVSIIKNMSDEDFKCFKRSDFDCFSGCTQTSMDKVTKAELLEFYEKNIKGNDRKLCIQIIGNSKVDIDENRDKNNNVKREKLQKQDRNLEKLKFVKFIKPKSGIFLIENLAEFKNKLKKF